MKNIPVSPLRGCPLFFSFVLNEPVKPDEDASHHRWWSGLRKG